jgi:predicted ArsR family transcriptional regulator
MLVTMWSAAEPSLAGLSVSAREVVLALKKRGEARANEIAEALGITPSAVRQHLSALRADGLVAYRKIHAGPGRPKFAYFLTEPAEALFPKTYHELTNEFLEHLEEEDPELLVRLFERRRRRRVEATRERLADKTFDEKVATLARVLDEDGYLADFERRPDGTYLIREHNCAISGSRSVMASPAAPSWSSCGGLSPTPRSTASPTRSRAPTYAPTKYDLGGDDPRSVSRKTEALKGLVSQTVVSDTR